MEMWNFQFQNASDGLLQISRAQIFIQKHIHLSHKILYWSQTTTNTPNIIKSSQSMFNIQQVISLNQRFTRYNKIM
jgi:hypothetical protein